MKEMNEPLVTSENLELQSIVGTEAPSEPTAELPAQLTRFNDVWSFVTQTAQNPTRFEQSDKEKSKRILGRLIRRDIKQQTDFLQSKYFPHQGKKEMARRADRLLRAQNSPKRGVIGIDQVGLTAARNYVHESLAAQS